MECYSVKAMFGHVGRSNGIIKEVAVLAENGKEAANKVRWMSRVKHNRKDAIQDCKKISWEEYVAIKERTANDPFFKCHSKQEQDLLCGDMTSQIISLKHDEPINFNEKRDDKIKFMKRKQKIQLEDAYYQIRHSNYYSMEGTM